MRDAECLSALRACAPLLIIQGLRAPLRFALAPGYLLLAPPALGATNLYDKPVAELKRRIGLRTE